MAQIQFQNGQGQFIQQGGAGQPNFNGQNVAVAPAGEPKNDLAESVIFSAPESFFDRVGGMLNSKKWYNDTATANYTKYEQGKKDKYLQAAFENWVKSADEHGSDVALNRLIALFKDGKVYLGELGENLKSYQFSTPLDLFRITVKSGTLTHWSALLEAFKAHWDSQTDFDRILLSQGAILCRMLSERAPRTSENKLFLEDLKQFGIALYTKLCEQSSYLFDLFLAKVFYDLEMAFEKEAFLKNLSENAATYGQVYLNSLLAGDFYLTDDVKSKTLGNAGLYREVYAQNALTALSNFVADRLSIEVKDNGVYVNGNIFTLQEAQFLSHLALELKDMPKKGDIPLNQLAAFLTAVGQSVTDPKFKAFLISALSLLPQAAKSTVTEPVDLKLVPDDLKKKTVKPDPVIVVQVENKPEPAIVIRVEEKQAPVVVAKVEEKPAPAIAKEPQEKLFVAFEIFKGTQSRRGLDDYVPGSVELNLFLKQCGGKKMMKSEVENERKILVSFLEAIKFNCFKKPSNRESAEETGARHVLESAIQRLSGNVQG